MMFTVKIDLALLGDGDLARVLRDVAGDVEQHGPDPFGDGDRLTISSGTQDIGTAGLRPGMPEAQAGAVEHILDAVSGTVFRSEDGGVIILAHRDPYVISVDEGGHTVSAYLVTVPPAEIAEAMDADRDEIGGWVTGWEC